MHKRFLAILNNFENTPLHAFARLGVPTVLYTMNKKV